ncbi:Methyltransferase, FkbM family protein [Minicystis rosea]|nr:Methyltransferase, FkbM family protein [Minicystis rosea]
MKYPSVPEEERTGVAYLAAVLPFVTQPVRMKHPFLDLEMELPHSLGARLFYLASVGEYELSDLELLERYVKRGDAVMEVGGGIGLTAALSAKLSERPVTVVEPDERLFPLIRRQVELNGGEVGFVHGAVTATSSASDDVEFFLHEEAWFSSLRPAAEGEPRRISVRVPRLSLPEVFAARRPTVAMIDIEGAEDGLFEGAYPYLPATLLLEIHFPHLGETRGARVMQSLIDHGYRLLDCYGWTFVFQRP